MSKRGNDELRGQFRCPVCGSQDSVPILYGMPGEELFEQSERGEIELGGCVVGEDDPDRACRACGARFVITTVSRRGSG